MTTLQSARPNLCPTALTAAAIVCFAAAAQAQTWTGAGPDNKWTTGSNWDTGSPPATPPATPFFSGATFNGQDAGATIDLDGTNVLLVGVGANQQDAGLLLGEDPARSPNPSPPTESFSHTFVNGTLQLGSVDGSVAGQGGVFTFQNTLQGGGLTIFDAGGEINLDLDIRGSGAALDDTGQAVLRIDGHNGGLIEDAPNGPTNVTIGAWEAFSARGGQNAFNRGGSKLRTELLGAHTYSGETVVVGFVHFDDDQSFGTSDLFFRGGRGALVPIGDRTLANDFVSDANVLLGLRVDAHPTLGPGSIDLAGDIIHDTGGPAAANQIFAVFDGTDFTLSGDVVAGTSPRDSGINWRGGDLRDEVTGEVIDRSVITYAGQRTGKLGETEMGHVTLAFDHDQAFGDPADSDNVIRLNWQNSGLEAKGGPRDLAYGIILSPRSGPDALDGTGGAEARIFGDLTLSGLLQVNDQEGLNVVEADDKLTLSGTVVPNSEDDNNERLWLGGDGITLLDSTLVVKVPDIVLGRNTLQPFLPSGTNPFPVDPTIVSDPRADSGSGRVQLANGVSFIDEGIGNKIPDIVLNKDIPLSPIDDVVIDDANLRIFGKGTPGLISGTDGGSLTIGPNRSLILRSFDTTPAETLRLVDGAEVTFNGAVEGEADIVFEGGTRDSAISGGAVYVNGSVTPGAGGNVQVDDDVVLGGNGTINASLAATGGTIAPGASAGTLTVTGGDITMDADSTLAIELAGTAAGDFDVLVTDNTFNAGGTLDVSLINGFTPGSGDSFDVLDFASASGVFDSILLPTLSGGLSWDTDDLLSSGLLSVIGGGSFLAGDANNDGVVSSADFAAVQSNFSATGASDGSLPGDANGDGVVSSADFASIQSNFGNSQALSTTSLSLAAVPEPSTAMLASLLGLGAALRRRRHA